jgi:aspartate ammonia-lyase
MKIKFGELEHIVRNIAMLLKEKVPIHVGVSLTRFVRRLDEEVKIYTDAKKKILSDNGAEADEKGLMSIEPGSSNYEKAVKEIEELNKQEIEIEITKIKTTDLGGIKMTTEELYTLSFLFEDLNNE